MEKFVRVTGIAAALPRINVDTDAIMPKKWCVTTSREGLGRGLFAEWRYAADETTENPDFVLNHPACRGARILVAGANFGCGSSREHAVWAHLDFGIRAIVASSFASIFYGNCFNNGLLPVRLPEPVVLDILRQLEARPGAAMSVDLDACAVTGPDGAVHPFTVEPAARQALLEGLDEIGATLKREAAIAAFQAADRTRRPWLWSRSAT